MSISTALFICTAVVFCTYFVLFQRTFRLLAEQEQQRFVQEAGTSPWWGLVAFIAILATLVINSASIRLLLVLLMLGGLGWATHRQHQRIRALDFDRSFERKLLRISVLSPLGILLLVGAFSNL